MSIYLKTCITAILVIGALTACKPGVYYPFGDTNAPPNNISSQTSTYGSMN